MHRASALLLLVSAAAACGTLRNPVAPAPPAETRDVARDGRSRTPRGEVGQGRHLGCLENPRIDAWERKLRYQPELREATEDSLERGQEYLPKLRRIMADQGLPPSLALLPVIESGFYPHARGRRGDLGLWQLQRATARRFGLVVDRRRDERLQPDRATLAAARYLRVLHSHYRDWPLALAAYNAGETRVDRALRRRPSATFWDLADRGQLSRTSRNFVPHFLAVVRLSEDMSACGRADGRPMAGQQQAHRQTDR